jgi:hypothetical protein
MPLKHAAVRALLGIYFVFLFFQIYFLKANLLETFGSFDFAFFAGAVTVAVYFAIFSRSILAPMLLFIWLFVFVRMNPLAKEVYFDYIGWMLLYFAVHAVAQRYEVRDEYFSRAALWTLGSSYTASGLVKLMSGVWQSGEVLSQIRTQGFFLPWTNSFVTSASLTQLEWFAKSTTLLEVSALPLILYSRTRFLIWGLLTFMQIGLLLTTRINHISAAMLIFHALCFDPRWLKAKELA